MRNFLSIRLFVAGIFVSAAIYSLPVIADDGDAERGRLPDGRAFRTDQEGNQLVDYIAELELEKEGLEGRIFKLQDQLRDSQAGEVAKQECPTAPVAESKPRECPEVSCPKIEQITCPKVEPVAFSCPACESNESKIKALEGKITKLANENVELDSEKGTLIEDLEECHTKTERAEARMVSLSESLDGIKKALADRDASLVAARGQVADLRQEREALLAAQKVAARAVQASDESRASLRNSEASAVRSSSALSGRSSSALSGRSSSMASSALISARAQLLSRIGDIKSQVRARDVQFSKIDQRGRALQVHPSPMRTRSGFDLKSAEAAINDAASFKRLSEISKEINELARMVSDDIELGARLGKHR